MKTVKLDHGLALKVLDGTKTSTWRLFDDKDLSVDDVIDLIDKVDPADQSTWHSIGTATITKVICKPLGKITTFDMEGHEPFTSTDEMVRRYRRYYGNDVNESTEVKILHFVLDDK